MTKARATTPGLVQVVELAVHTTEQRSPYCLTTVTEFAQIQSSSPGDERRYLVWAA